MKTVEEANVTNPATVDLEQTAQYLEALTGSRDTPVTWCTLQKHAGRARSSLLLYGSLAEHEARLRALNSGGCGVFIAVNTVKHLSNIV